MHTASYSSRMLSGMRPPCCRVGNIHADVEGKISNDKLSDSEYTHIVNVGDSKREPRGYTAQQTLDRRIWQEMV